MIAWIAAAALQTVAPPPPPPASGPDIVITGVRLEDSRAALDRCLARHCPPKEDIAATLDHAENLFAHGAYADARTVLLASRRRNARFAESLPVEVAGLTRANARIAGLVGQADAERIGTIDTLAALKAGLPDGDPRVLMQRLEVADVFARQGRIDAATQTYGDVAKQAHRLGLPYVEGHALFRTAVLYGAIASVRADYRAAARRAADRITNTTDPAMAPFRNGVLLLRARLDKDAGRPGALDEVLARFRDHPTPQPLLVYAPLVEWEQAGSGGSHVVKMRGDDHSQWADVSFWIAPDGRVRDADVLRRSDNFAGTWLDAAMKALKGRRYAPLALDPTDPGVLRVERYSLVSDVTVNSGSRIIDRSADRRIEVLDMTAPQAAAPKSRG